MKEVKKSIAGETDWNKVKSNLCNDSNKNGFLKFSVVITTNFH